jgi:catechol 2,3-dioxygenase-like lactoylglutathione lyase family enzyme
MNSRLLAAGLAVFLAAGVSLAKSGETESSRSNKQTGTSQADSLIAEGWREAVISVSDLDEHAAFFTSVMGWQIIADGLVPRAQLSAWKLPANASARFALVANPDSETGFVRILDFDGVDQVRIRDHDQAWETGGIFNINTRVADMAAISKEITEAGWQAPSAPVQFTFGPFVVWEWIPRHKDGVRIAFIERVAPPLEGWPHLKTTSRTFNSTQIVADIDRAAAFYEDVLGFETYLDVQSKDDEPAEHVLGMSREAMTSIARNVKVIEPTGKNAGSVELLQFVGYSGRDFSARAKPPNLGHLMLRFPVDDIDALAAYLRMRDVDLEYAPTETALAPYGRVKLLAIRAPDGAWLEFFEEMAGAD